jgi:WD40 repeat protein
VFSQDGKHIVLGSSDNTIGVWDADTGAIVSGPFEGHTGIFSVTFSQDGKCIVLGSDDNTIWVQDTDPGNIISKPPNSGINSVAVSQDCLKMLGRADIFKKGKFNGFQNDTQLENGWILNMPSELLFWVPPWARIGLWWPANTAVIADQSTKLDLSQFVHGTSWTHCRDATHDYLH